MDDRVPRPMARAAPTRRTLVVGSLIALLAMAGLGWLAWDLTHAQTSANPRGAAAGARSGGGPGGRGAPATTVGVAAATKADLPVMLDALGTVTPTATVTVRPQVSGVLKQVLYREGQMVKSGQLLALIDPRPFEMALMQAEGQRMRDQAQLENARVTLLRFQTLLQQDSIARQDVDTQAALVKQLEAAVVSDHATEGTARLNLAYTRITSPVEGRVGLRVVDAGNLVSSNDANGIAVITRISPIDVEFAVPQDVVPELMSRADEPAPLKATALDRTRTTVLAEGRFLTLDNLVDTQTGTVRAKARFDNAGNALFPNQFVNLRLQVRTITGAVVVPVTAMRHGPSGDYVYVLDRSTHTVALRSVTRGLASGERVQVATGLQPGEEVITEGADRLRDGARVVLPGERAASGPMGAASGARRRHAGPEATSGDLPGPPASAARWQRRASDAAPAS